MSRNVQKTKEEKREKKKGKRERERERRKVSDFQNNFYRRE